MVRETGTAVPAGCDTCGGDAHATTLASTNIAGTSVSPNWHDRVADGENPVPVTVTSVPPSSGPVVGDTDSTRTGDAYANRAAAADPIENSCPFNDTPTDTVAAPTSPYHAGASHNTAVGDSHTAGTSLARWLAPAKRHINWPELRNSPPETVTCVPPAWGPDRGVTDDTAGRGRYVKSAPDAL